MTAPTRGPTKAYHNPGFLNSKDARARGETEQRLHGLAAWRETTYYSEKERAALAWTDGSAISFQFHPEFSPDFAKALIAQRYDRVPDPDAAIASLDGPNDNQRVGDWIRRFLTAPQPL